MGRKLLIATLLAVAAIVPSKLDAAARGGREKSRSHKTRSEKSARNTNAKSKNKRQKKESGSDRGEFDRQWEQEQVEPTLPESE
ncbi:MAG: hypothetical protein ACJ8KU_01715 [Chthoniobacterales bacterium]